MSVPDQEIPLSDEILGQFPLLQAADLQRYLDERSIQLEVYESLSTAEKAAILRSAVKWLWPPTE